jgi:hypothetical protein
MDKHLDAETLSEYAEGLLEARARAAADTHLAGCADCRRELMVVQAYFRDLSGLEPIQAPADFLAKVRARLPRPSPWRRAWAAVATPLRAVPLPIAVALVLGVTAITVYIKEGGSENRAMLPAPEPLSAPSTVAALPSADKDVAAEKASPPARAHEDRAVPSAATKPLPRRRIGNAPRAMGAPVPPSLAELRAVAPKAAYGASAPLPSRPNEDADALKQSASAPPSAPSPELSPTAPGGGKDEAVVEYAAKRKAEAGREPAAPVDKPVPAPVAIPGYAVTLRNAGDTAAVLSGLRSMGIEAAPASASAKECAYKLLVPAPMLRELGPYLARHGASRAEGRQPEAVSGTRIPMRLRLLFPTP